MANITGANWAAFAATSPAGWTIDLTNRIFEFTEDPALDPVTLNEFVTFVNPFDDDIPVTLIIPRISQQTDDVSIRIHNATIYFKDGAANFSGTRTNTFAGQGDTINTSIDIQNCIFIASNGESNGFGGSAGRADQNTTGTLSNCTFHGINAATSWFVNTAGIPAVSLVGNTYNQSALHAAEFFGGDLDGTPSVMTGVFDGTTRQNSNGRYTLRRVDFDDANTWAYHTDCTLAGTGYRTTTGTANNQESIYQINATQANQLEFSLNNQIESSNYSFQKTNTASMTMYDGYTWNPVFVDRVSADQVTDVRLTHDDIFGDTTTSRVFTCPTTVDFEVNPATWITEL